MRRDIWIPLVLWAVVTLAALGVAAFLMDPFPTEASDDFTDVATGGTLLGRITLRGDGVSVEEEPNPGGVRVRNDLNEGAVGRVQHCLGSFTPQLERGVAKANDDEREEESPEPVRLRGRPPSAASTAAVAGPRPR